MGAKPLPLLMSRRDFRWAVLCVWTMAGLWILSAAYADGVLSTYEFRGRTGLGLLQHYGFVFSYLAGPIICLCVRHSLHRLDEFQTEIIERQGDADRPEIFLVVASQRRSLALGTWPSRIALSLLILGGAAAYIVIYSRVNTGSYEGWQVFNARMDLISFAPSAIYLFLLWWVVYPLAIFYSACVALSSYTLVDRLGGRGMLKLDPLHPGRSGGVEALKGLSLAPVAVQLPLTGMLIATAVTFRGRHPSMIQALILLIVCFIVLDGLILWKVEEAFNQERRRELDPWNRLIAAARGKPGLGGTKTLIAMEYRENLLNMRLFSWEGYLMPAISVAAVVATIAT